MYTQTYVERHTLTYTHNMHNTYRHRHTCMGTDIHTHTTQTHAHAHDNFKALNILIAIVTFHWSVMSLLHYLFVLFCFHYPTRDPQERQGL